MALCDRLAFFVCLLQKLLQAAQFVGLPVPRRRGRRRICILAAGNIKASLFILAVKRVDGRLTLAYLLLQALDTLFDFEKVCGELCLLRGDLIDVH